MNTDTVKSIIAEYKKDFSRIDKEERYKWEAIQCFQKNWGPNAADFEQMLKNATAKAKNLLDSFSVFPRGMILEYAHNFPEETRQWFADLFDENVPLLDRFLKADEAAEELNKKYYHEPNPKKEHFQDAHAISVYLTFRYPEKYCFYKRTMFVAVARRIGFEGVPKQGNKESLPNYFKMADEVRQIVLQDEELKKLSASRLDGKCYDDRNFTILTQDIILFAQKNDPNKKPAPRYWVGGCDWDGVSKKEEFLNSKRWVLGREKADVKGSKGAQKAWDNLNIVCVGDQLALKGYGGQNDLVIYGLGEVTGVDTEKGTVSFEPREDVALFHGKAPSNPGGWFGSLEEVTGKAAIEAIFKTEKGTDEADDTPIQQIVPALNTIFYGPPGTGKTYTLLEEIAKKYFYEQVGQLTEAERNATIVENLCLWEVTALCLLDKGGRAKVPQIMDHPLIEAYFKKSASKSPANAVWGQLQIHTKEDCPEVKYDMARRADPKVFTKSADSTWIVDRKLIEEIRKDLTDSLKEFHTKTATSEIKRYKFVTFHQSYSYENFVEGICAETDENGNIHYDVKPGVFREFCQKAQNDPDHNYALFIDEINRGNVSGIFGELITLIEDDKRGGLPLTLPYSKADFLVPKNLYLIGSMNTADRSIDALDSALRRRFAFVEMGPKPELLSGEKFAPKYLDVDLVALLNTLNQRVEFLLDRDHRIGHSYFMKIQAGTKAQELNNLQKVFHDQIIPLLEDYFYGNLEKVQMILGEKFIRKSGELTANCLMCGKDSAEFQDKTCLEGADISALTEEDFRNLYQTK